MAGVLRSVVIGSVIALLSVLPAHAQDKCMDEKITASGPASDILTLGAFPGSKTAWQNAAREKHGASYGDWDHSQQREINCKEEAEAGSQKWTCTRIAVACPKGGLLGNLTGNSCKKITASRLERGDKGEQVVLLQKCLNERHGESLTTDGDYGRGTREAVRRFQRKNDLGADGTVGPLTLAKLQG